jgi:hypothetical protein
MGVLPRRHGRVLDVAEPAGAVTRKCINDAGAVMSMKQAFDYRLKETKPSVIELHEAGWTQLAISVCHDISPSTVGKMIRRATGVTRARRAPTPEKKERNNLMYIQRVYDKRTYRSIGEEHDVSPDRVCMIVKKIEKRHRHWWWNLNPSYYWYQPLTDPDGIGEFEDEWTAEEQALDIYQEWR